MNIMQKNKTIVRDFDQYLDEEYGAIDTEERTKFEEEAKVFMQHKYFCKHVRTLK